MNNLTKRINFWGIIFSVTEKDCREAADYFSSLAEELHRRRLVSERNMPTTEGFYWFTEDLIRGSAAPCLYSVYLGSQGGRVLWLAKAVSKDASGYERSVEGMTGKWSDEVKPA